MMEFGKFSMISSLSASNEDKEVGILYNIEIIPTICLTKVSEDVGVSRSSSLRILKQHHFCPYKFKCIHNMNLTKLYGLSKIIGK